MVLDRLEKAKYVKRERHPRDRRSVLVNAVPPRKMAKIHKIYEPVNEAMDQIFSAYDDKQLSLTLDFFQKTNHLRKQGLPAAGIEEK